MPMETFPISVTLTVSCSHLELVPILSDDRVLYLVPDSSPYHLDGDGNRVQGKFIPHRNGHYLEYVSTEAIIPEEPPSLDLALEAASIVVGGPATVTAGKKAAQTVGTKGRALCKGTKNKLDDAWKKVKDWWKKPKKKVVLRQF